MEGESTVVVNDVDLIMTVDESTVENDIDGIISVDESNVENDVDWIMSVDESTVLLILLDVDGASVLALNTDQNTTNLSIAAQSKNEKTCYKSFILLF